MYSLSEKIQALLRRNDEVVEGAYKMASSELAAIASKEDPGAAGKKIASEGNTARSGFEIAADLETMAKAAEEIQLTNGGVPAAAVNVSPAENGAMDVAEGNAGGPAAAVTVATEGAVPVDSVQPGNPEISVGDNAENDPAAEVAKAESAEVDLLNGQKEAEETREIGEGGDPSSIDAAVADKATQVAADVASEVATSVVASAEAGASSAVEKSAEEEKAEEEKAEEEKAEEEKAEEEKAAPEETAGAESKAAAFVARRKEAAMALLALVGIDELASAETSAKEAAEAIIAGSAKTAGGFGATLKGLLPRRRDMIFGGAGALLGGAAAGAAGYKGMQNQKARFVDILQQDDMQDEEEMRAAVQQAYRYGLVRGANSSQPTA